MHPPLILWPVAAHIGLVLFIFIRLGQVKSRARAAGAIDPAVTALDNDAWPDDCRQVANNMRNQFQVPVLFYVLALALFSLGAVDIWALTISWLFVATRIAHTAIHIGKNHVPSRTRVFSIGVLLVLALLVLLFRALVTQAG